VYEKVVKELVSSGKMDLGVFNIVYGEICDELGIDIAVRIHQMYRGMQITFPMRLINPEYISRCVMDEYDGSNLKELAVKYSYSEKTIRRMIKKQIKA